MNKIFSSTWQLKKLWNIAKIIGWWTPSTTVSEYRDGNIPWITPTDLWKIWEIIALSNSEKKVTQLWLKNSSAKLLPPWSVLLSTRASIGKIAINEVEVCTNQWFASFICNADVYNRYLAYVLKVNIEKIIGLSNSTTFKEVSKSNLAELQIPLPPLATQRTIAAKLDQIQSLIDLKKEAISKTQELTKSIFLEMFGDPMTNEKGWEVRKLADVLESANYWTSQKANEDWLWIEILRMNNITYDWWRSLESMKHIEFEGSNDYEKYTVKKWDILFNRTNSKELVWKTAVYVFDEPRAFAWYLVRLRTDDKVSNPYYISAFLNSSYGKSVLFGMAKNIVWMANINAQEVQSIRIPLPPLALQQKFAGTISHIHQALDDHKQSLAKLEELFQATMQECFG